MIASGVGEAVRPTLAKKLLHNCNTNHRDIHISVSSAHRRVGVPGAGEALKKHASELHRAGDDRRWAQSRAALGTSSRSARG
jgi:hypothetical protein